MSDSGKLKLEGASEGCSFLKPRKYWLHSNTQPRTQTMISKVLRQRDLYHNPDPLGQLVGEANESKVIVEGQETRALLDSGSQIVSYFMDMGKKLKLEPKQLQSIYRLRVQGVLEVPYLGYVEVQLKIPDVKAFDQDVLLLIVPDSAHTQYTPITLGTLHIDMAIKLATEKELKTL